MRNPQVTVSCVWSAPPDLQDTNGRPTHSYAFRCSCATKKPSVSYLGGSTVIACAPGGAKPNVFPRGNSANPRPCSEARNDSTTAPAEIGWGRVQIMILSRDTHHAWHSTQWH